MKTFLSGILATAVSMGAAQASVVWQLDDDGTGATRLRLSGTFDVSSGSDSGSGAAGAFIVSNSDQDSVTLTRRTTPATVSNGLVFSLTSGSGSILASGFGELSIPDVSFDDLSVQVFGVADIARIFGWDGNTTGTLSEDFVLPALPFSSFNSGIWEYGDPSISNAGLRLEIGQDLSAVPLPGGLVLLGGGLALAGAVRARRKPS